MAAKLKVLGFKVFYKRASDSYVCFIKSFSFEIHPGIILAWGVTAGSKTEQTLLNYNLETILEFMENFDVNNENKT